MSNFLQEKNFSVQVIQPFVDKEYAGVCIYGTGKITENNIPSHSGIYLIGEINYEDDTNRLVYKIKVGQGKNLRKRLNTYTTYSTSIKLLDINYVHEIMLDKEEQRMHNILDQFGWHVGNTEWYVVSEKNYKILKQYGFSGINKLST